MSTTASGAEHVSVVMCTRNRAGSIGQAVRSVLASHYPDFDLTVVDQSTDDATGALLRPIAESDPRLHYVYTDQAGLSRAYNVGIRATSGDLLAFTDDDCVPAPDWIGTIVAAFAAEPDGDLLYGQVVPYVEGDTETPMLTFDRPKKLSKRDGFRVFGMGANFAARRRVFNKAGYFDEILGGGGPLKSSQDFDFAYRVYKAGGVVLLRPEVTMRHDGHRDGKDWPNLFKAYGAGDGAFYLKHARCFDPYACYLLGNKLVMGNVRIVGKALLRRPGGDRPYMAGFLRGMRDSFKFKVDRRARLYVDPMVRA